MTTPASPLLDFLMQYLNDPELQLQFSADPVGVMTEAGLSVEEQEIVVTRNLEALDALVNASPDPGSYHFQFQDLPSQAATKYTFDDE